MCRADASPADVARRRCLNSNPVHPARPDRREPNRDRQHKGRHVVGKLVGTLVGSEAVSFRCI